MKYASTFEIPRSVIRAIIQRYITDPTAWDRLTGYLYNEIHSATENAVLTKEDIRRAVSHTFAGLFRWSEHEEKITDDLWAYMQEL